MKPIRLVIEGINSFTDAQTLDFEAVGRTNLFCISGKTGAGKTTIFDSLMIALYGKSSKGNIADAVNLSRMTGKVTLDFGENGDVYTVVRTIKCRFEKNPDGSMSDKRAAITDCVLSRNGAFSAKGEEATQRITEIIGLEPAEFKNVYLLEQGEYAEFLKKTPQKQKEVVGKIFSLMRFADVYKLAGERMREHEQRAQSKREWIERLGEASPEALKEKKKELAALKAKITTLKNAAEKMREELAALEKTHLEYVAVREKQANVKNLMIQSDEAQSRLFAAERALADFEAARDDTAERKLAALREDLNALSALNALDRECADAEKTAANKLAASELAAKRASRVESECVALVAEREKRDAEYVRATERLFEAIEAAPRMTEALASAKKRIAKEPDVLAAAEVSSAVQAERRRCAELEKRRDALAETAEKRKGQCDVLLGKISLFAAELEKLVALEAEAERAEKQTGKALSQAQLLSHAAAVRAELGSGDICPVCGGVIGDGCVAGDTDVEKRKAEHENTVAELKAAANKRAECAAAEERAKTDYGRACDALKEVQAELSALERESNALGADIVTHDTVIAALEAVKRASENCAIAAKKCTEKAPELFTVKAELELSRIAAQEAEERARSLALGLGESRGKTDAEIARVRTDLEAAEKEVKAIETERNALAAGVASARAACDAVAKSLEKAKAECPVDAPEFDEAGFEEKRAERERTEKLTAECETKFAVEEAEAVRLEKECEQLKQLKAELKAIDAAADVYAKISEFTKGKAMLDYVAAEYIAEFTAVASSILGELSGGKFSMSYDSGVGFIVSDFLNGGKRRKTDTLSGGELFLASLAVAIAIARTQSNGNNAFFFLDEGFGTLDDELIDTVYGALEMLSAKCLVGVITHAGALIDRMPSVVTVHEATDTSGSRIEY